MSRVKIRWLNRQLVELHCHLVLCISQNEYAAVMRHLGYNPDAAYIDGDEGKGAALHLHKNTADPSENVAVVCVNPLAGFTGPEMAALLVHEAAHIFRWQCRHMGERHPSEEFEAYSIQSIALELMQGYSKALTKG